MYGRSPRTMSAASLGRDLDASRRKPRRGSVGGSKVCWSWCAVKGFRDKERTNPAVWRDNLKHMLSKQKKEEGVRNHPAMPWEAVPTFMAELRERPALAARALELLILTAARSGEVLEAKRDEFGGDLWAIPAERMKARVKHTVPLTRQAVAIIAALPVLDGNPYLFPGQAQGRPLSNMALEMLLRRMGCIEITPHGFRSSFRDWAAECSSAPGDIAERCLAHTVGSESRKSIQSIRFNG